MVGDDFAVRGYFTEKLLSHSCVISDGARDIRSAGGSVLINLLLPLSDATLRPFLSRHDCSVNHRLPGNKFLGGEDRSEMPQNSAKWLLLKLLSDQHWPGLLFIFSVRLRMSPVPALVLFAQAD
jgi:hypothetical protein